MNIRLMKAEDYDRVYQLWTSTSGMGMRSLDDSYEGIHRFLLRNPNTSFVAEEGDAIIGVVLCGHDGRRGYLYHMAVDEKHRRRGIGEKLLDAALGALKAEGIHKAALVVFSTNEIGNSFWESVGFKSRNDLVYRDKSLNDNNT